MKNLKKIIAFVVFLSISPIVKAQSVDTNNAFKFGVKGGVNFSNLISQNVESNSVLTGFHAGLFTKIPISNSLAIQPELLYTTKGAKLTYNNYFVNGTAKFNLNYLELPVLVVVNLTPNFSIHAGPYFSYLLDGKATNDVRGTLLDIESNLNNKDYSQIDTGVTLGVGYDASTIGFGVRYNYGLQKVGKERSFLGTNYTFPDGKNSVINLYLTYSIL